MPPFSKALYVQIMCLAHTVNPAMAFLLHILAHAAQKKGIDKKLLIRAAHDFNSQYLNLFGFRISVSFV